MTGHQIPDVDIVIVREAKTPFAELVHPLEELGINFFNDIPCILRGSSQARLLTDQPTMVTFIFVWIGSRGLVDYFAGLGISYQTKDALRLHGEILQESAACWIIPMNMTTDEVARFNDIVLAPDLLVASTCLMADRVLFGALKNVV